MGTVSENRIFLQKIQENVQENITLLSSFDVENFIRSRNCRFYNKYFGEITSMVDQSICITSEYFYEWRASSWSGRVRNLRDAKSKLDGKVYKTENLLKLLIQNL